jgi:hypothetical protein
VGKFDEQLWGFSLSAIRVRQCLFTQVSGVIVSMGVHLHPQKVAGLAATLAAT